MADSTDRRAAERFAVSAGAGCTFAGRVAEDLGPVKLRDVSMSGVGLLVSRRVEVGSLLVLGLATAPGAANAVAKTVLVRVAHVTAVPGGFLVGGTFAEPLSYQEFTALVM
jgi:hypothetical protein